MQEYEGKKLKFHSVNAALTADLAKYRVTSKPHFLVLKDGERPHKPANSIKTY